MVKYENKRNSQPEIKKKKEKKQTLTPPCKKKNKKETRVCGWLSLGIS